MLRVEPIGAVNSYSPSKLVILPFVVPFTTTLAPITGSPVLASKTFPLILAVCCAMVGSETSAIPVGMAEEGIEIIPSTPANNVYLPLWVKVLIFISVS